MTEGNCPRGSQKYQLKDRLQNVKTSYITLG